MKKSIIFIGLAGFIVVGGIAGYFLWQSTQTAQGFFTSGKKYYDQKKYPEAIVQFLNSLKKDAHHRDSRFYLALSYLEDKNLAGAVKSLRALLEYYPDDIPANLQLGNLDLLGGKTNAKLFHQAWDYAQKVIAKDPQNVRALVLAGEAAAGFEDYAASVDAFDKATKLAPKDATAFFSLGNTLRMQKNYPDAEKAFLTARQIDPKNQIALLALANYYRTVEDPVKAEATYKEGLSLFPSERSVFMSAVAYYVQVKRYDAAEAVLREAQRVNPKDPFPSLQLANLYQNTNRAQDELKLLLDLKPKFPKDIEVVGKLASRLMQTQPDRARVEIDQILKDEPMNPLGLVLLGELQFRTGQFDAAENTLKKERAVNSRLPLPHFYLGNLAARKGQVDQAVDHYQKALAVDGSYVPARVALAETLMMKGLNADARVETRKALEDQPENTSARLLNARLDVIDQNYPEAERELTTLATQQPNNPVVQRELGVYYDLRGKTAEAERSFLRALELAPKSELDFRNLILFYIKTKQVERASLKLNTIPDAQRQAFHYELVGVVASATGQSQHAENAFKKALEKDPKSTTAERLLFDQYVRSGHLDDALKVIDDRIKQNPANATAHALKGGLYEQQKKTDLAKQSYLRALQIDPNIDLAANNLSLILAEEGGDLTPALGYAQGVRKRHPSDANAADTLAWVYYKMGRPVLAKDSAEFAASKQPDNPEFQYHLAAIYRATNQRTESEKALKKALASSKDFKDKSAAQDLLKEIDKWRHLVP